MENYPFYTDELTKFEVTSLDFSLDSLDSIYGSGGCIADDTIYFFGGGSNGGYNNDLYSLDLKNRELSLLRTTGSPPKKTFHPSLFYWDGKLYTVFGYSGEYLNELFEFDLKENKWKSIKVEGGVPCGRTAQATTLYGSTIFVSGGYSSRGGDLSDTWSLNLDSKVFQWKKYEDCPFSTRYHNIVGYNGFIYSFSLDSKCASLDIDSNTWSSINSTNLPQFSEQSVSFVYLSKICFLYGDKAGVFDLSTNIFQNVELKNSYVKACAYAFNHHTGNLYTIGGEKSDNYSLVRCMNFIPLGWSTKHHRYFTKEIKDTILTLIMTRQIYKSHSISRMPKPILFLIFEFLTSPPYKFSSFQGFDSKNSFSSFFSNPFDPNKKKNCVLY
eukprot:TRINITY_DN1686_c1_g1_i1.p1 TRINITY_DN1686_c1_g1~~TRINITY_DN1686_c1_g1_i1.p1  ORF type:complete len:384 (-),score=66.81 TRINITY_DN1686_c1_g1_i1:104-1255(-)